MTALSSRRRDWTPSPTIRAVRAADGWPSRIAATLLGAVLAVQPPPPNLVDRQVVAPSDPPTRSTPESPGRQSLAGAIEPAVDAPALAMSQLGVAYDAGRNSAAVDVTVAPQGFDAAWQFELAVRGTVVRAGSSTDGSVTVRVSNGCALRSQSVTVVIGDASGHAASAAGILDRSACPPLADAPFERQRILARPTITKASFVDRLRAAGSPALAKGAELYVTFVDKGVNPSFALGMFHAESHSGTRGYAVITRNWGNILYHPWTRDYGAVPYKAPNGYTYARFPTWRAGARACAALLRRYDRLGFRTVSTASARWLGTREGSRRHLRYLDNITAAMFLLPDDAAPAMTALAVPARSGSPVAVAWRARDNIRVVGYRLRTRRGDGAWSAPVAVTGRTASLALRSGTWTVSVRALDAAGNRSPWRSGAVKVGP
jgi:hypothetical protein